MHKSQSGMCITGFSVKQGTWDYLSAGPVLGSCDHSGKEMCGWRTPQHLGRAGGTTAMQLPDYGQVGGAANHGRALLAEIVA